MPGLVGAFGEIDPSRAEAALAKLCALPGAVPGYHFAEPGVLLASACRAPRGGWPEATAALDDATVVVLHGALFRDGAQPRRLAAVDLLPVAKAGRLLEELASCDGSYAVAVLDLVAGTVTVVADPLGVQPVLFAQHGERFAFGPEAKAVLTLTGLEPRLSRVGMLAFLTSGYGLGEETLFEGVRCLEPGTVLTYDLAARRAEVRRYWQISYRRDPALRARRAAEEALIDAILRSHRLLLADGPPAHQVLLSGGLDSRAMLGALSRIHAPPAHAVSWGLRPDIRWSDAHLAGRMARRFGVPWCFLPYDTSHFVENAADWAFVSELANDNVGWYGEGLGSLRDFYARGAPVSFIGDEVWGNGPRVRSEDEMSEGAAMPYRLSPSIAAVLRPEVAEEANTRHRASLRAIVSRCTSSDPADQKDFLYINGRGARFIFSLGYYKEHATELRRPFLTRAVVDVITGLDPHYRRFKNLYATAILRAMPEVMTQPDNAVSSLPDWSYDVRTRPTLTAFFEEFLSARELERGPLAELVDPGALAATCAAFFGAPVSPLSRRPDRAQLLRRMLSLRSRALLSAYALPWPLPDGPPRDRGSTFDGLRRLALLALLQRQLPRFGEVAGDRESRPEERAPLAPAPAPVA